MLEDLLVTARASGLRQPHLKELRFVAHLTIEATWGSPEVLGILFGQDLFGGTRPDVRVTSGELLELPAIGEDAAGFRLSMAAPVVDFDLSNVVAADTNRDGGFGYRGMG